MLSYLGWACVARRAAVALGASAARGAGLGPQDRAEFLLLVSPVKFFPAADPEAKILAGLQLRQIHGSTLLEAPSPSSFSKEFCSKSSSTCSSGRRQQQEQQEQQHLQQQAAAAAGAAGAAALAGAASATEAAAAVALGCHSLPNSRSTRENEF